VPSVPSQPPSPSPAPSPSPSPEQPPVPSLDSLIISDIPDIFAEFRGKQISLLWRGSRDGFQAQEFHRRCDGHANTLTVIFDTNGNIFGGFTPVEWESRVHNYGVGDDNNCLKADDSLKNFLFTLNNPHNIPTRRFALKAEKKQSALYCNGWCGPRFGDASDICISSDCNTNTISHTFLGSSYTNDTGLDTDIILTGGRYFQVAEIEVFEITV
jgi:hypothetical protein